MATKFNISSQVPVSVDTRLRKAWPTTYDTPELDFVCVWSTDAIAIVQQPASSYPWLAWFHVSKSKRRQGLGSQLMSLLKILFPRIMLASHPTNVDAHTFYKSLGFKHVGLDDSGHYTFRWDAPKQIS